MQVLEVAVHQLGMMGGSFFSSSATSGSRRVAGKLRRIIGAVIFSISTYTGPLAVMDSACWGSNLRPGD
jgi:hypothetical protein